jgi:hypothetical protein
MRLLPALFTSENSSLPSGDNAMPYHHGLCRSMIVLRAPVRELEKNDRCFVPRIADSQEIEASVADHEIERVTQAVGDTFLSAALDWYTPDRAG